jgi:hypothetical protein
MALREGSKIWIIMKKSRALQIRTTPHEARKLK